MSKILFPLDSTLWQQYYAVLCSNFLARVYVMSIAFLTFQNLIVYLLNFLQEYLIGE